jgi:hypothetical protein
MLSGCASLQLLSFGASSISYAVSGKSLSDHAISTVMKQDCALHRPLVGEDACVKHDGTGVIRAPKPGQGRPRQASINTERQWQLVAEPPQRLLPAINKPASKAEPINDKPQILADNQVEVNVVPAFKQGFEQQVVTKPKLFAVVGSFNQLKYARNNLRKQKPGLNAQIMTNSAADIANGATKYRVVIGPIDPEQFSHQVGDIGERSHYHAWRLRLCGNSLQVPPCKTALLAAR